MSLKYEPALEPLQEGLASMDWKHTDLKADCEGRGGNYEWRPSLGKSGECWKEGKKRGLLPDGTEYNVPPEMAQRGPATLQQLADYFTPQVPPCESVFVCVRQCLCERECL